ncbi:MAG: hypothetical protein HDQ88_09545 [Clostridia bacterium]|nr:hypothetical protein [Clostridia bacterium]
MAIIIGLDDKYAAAERKAKENPFTIQGNPLAQPQEEIIEERRVSRNMRELERDAHIRRIPVSGGVYADIMTMRYGG